jgi:hypothetical protein
MPQKPIPGEYIPLVESMLWPTVNQSQLFIPDIYKTNIRDIRRRDDSDVHARKHSILP